MKVSFSKVTHIEKSKLLGKVVVSFFRDKLPFFFLEGQKHDAGLLHELQLHVISPLGQPLCIYRDPAYTLRVQLQVPYRNAMLTGDIQAFTTCMSEVRVAAEWLFGDIVNYFKFVDFKKNLKIGLSSVGKMYIVCAKLKNALTCLCSNTTSEFFHLHPPTLGDYFISKNGLNVVHTIVPNLQSFRSSSVWSAQNSWIIVWNYNLN